MCVSLVFQTGFPPTLGPGGLLETGGLVHGWFSRGRLTAKGMWLHEFAQAALSKSHRLGHSNDRNLSSHDSGGDKYWDNLHVTHRLQVRGQGVSRFDFF